MDLTTIIILVFIAIAVFLAIFVLLKSGKKKIEETDQKYIRKKWLEIMEETKNNPQHAILIADKLLAHTLKLRGYEGSLGEQLKKAAPLFADINKVWHAHKIRNKIAHEIDIHLTDKEVKNVISIFKSSLQNLGVKFN